MARNTEFFIKGLCTPLVVDLDQVAMIELMPDPEKLRLFFHNGFPVIVEPRDKPGISKTADVERIVRRWSGQDRSPDMVECWSDLEGPVSGCGHTWVDLAGCVAFTTKFEKLQGRRMRHMFVRFAESDGAARFFVLAPDDGMVLTEEEQNERLFLRWRRARGERI